MSCTMDPLLNNLKPLHDKIEIIKKDLKERLHKNKRAQLEKKRNTLIVRAMMIGDYIKNIN